MADKLKPVDVLLVGFGWTGAILGQELTDAGVNVLALARGEWRDTPTEFAPTFAQDELRYYWRHQLFERPAHSTLTIRNNVNETALPMRRLGSFLPGTNVGGAACTGTARPGASCLRTSSRTRTTCSATARPR